MFVALPMAQPVNAKLEATLVNSHATMRLLVLTWPVFK